MSWKPTYREDGTYEGIKYYNNKYITDSLINGQIILTTFYSEHEAVDAYNEVQLFLLNKMLNSSTQDTTGDTQ